jgi:hypothetical protein
MAKGKLETSFGIHISINLVMNFQWVYLDKLSFGKMKVTDPCWLLIIYSK